MLRNLHKRTRGSTEVQEYMSWRFCRYRWGSMDNHCRDSWDNSGSFYSHSFPFRRLSGIPRTRDSTTARQLLPRGRATCKDSM